MTFFQALKTLIESRILWYSEAKKLIFQSYYKDKIDGEEYDELMLLAERFAMKH